jgi:hypothetical protein
VRVERQNESEVLPDNYILPSRALYEPTRPAVGLKSLRERQRYRSQSISVIGEQQQLLEQTIETYVALQNSRE